MAIQRTAPTLADIQEARERIRGIARETPVYLSETFSRRCGREVRLKAENLQRTGAFKIRGAVNKLATLSTEERAAGVVAASAGNHGQAVAWAAREFGLHARIFVPLDAPMAKVEACRNYGAETEMAGADFEDALVLAMEEVETTGATFIHPYEDQLVVAGQGTIGLELLEQAPEVETVAHPDRRRRPLARHRDGAARRLAGGPARRRAGRARRLHDRRRDQGQDPERLHDAAARRPPRRHRRGDGRGDQRGDRAPARAREARRRGRRRGRRRRAAGRQGGRDRHGDPRPVRWQHRPDHVDLRDAPRPDVRRALPRRAHASRRSAGRADQAAVARRRGARERHRGRAPPRGHGHPGFRDARSS